MDPESWWITYGTSAPLLQNLALKAVKGIGALIPLSII